MLSTKRRKSGQVTIEYAVIVGILATLLFATNVKENFVAAIDSYFSDVASLVNLPIP